MLYRRFLWRLKVKYYVRDFHPLIFFYGIGGIFWILTIALGIRVIIIWVTTGIVPSINALAALFSFMSASLFTLFAMWFDMDQNKELK